MVNFKEHLLELPNQVFEEIKDKLHVVDCSVDQAFVYEGQTPIVGYLLVSGKARLSKRKNQVDIHRPLTLIGMREFLEHSKFPYTLNIEQGSKVGYLDRSTMLALLQEPDSLFTAYLTKSLAL